MKYKNIAINDNQVKPKVIGWKRTHANNKKILKCDGGLPCLKGLHVKLVARTDLQLFGLKSRFRPVYDKA